VLARPLRTESCSVPDNEVGSIKTRCYRAAGRQASGLPRAARPVKPCRHSLPRQLPGSAAQETNPNTTPPFGGVLPKAARRQDAGKRCEPQGWRPKVGAGGPDSLSKPGSVPPGNKLAGRSTMPNTCCHPTAATTGIRVELKAPTPRRTECHKRLPMHSAVVSAPLPVPSADPAGPASCALVSRPKIGDHVPLECRVG
jgi:hypothetical protein